MFVSPIFFKECTVAQPSHQHQRQRASRSGSAAAAGAAVQQQQERQRSSSRSGSAAAADALPGVRLPQQSLQYELAGQAPCVKCLTPQSVQLLRNSGSCIAAATQMTLDATPLSVLAYSCCSGTMLLINKLAVHHVGCPSVLPAIQLFVVALWCLGGKYSGLMPVDDFEWSKVKAYLCYVLVFTLSILTNMQSLAASNVDTVIVFRACTPLVVALLDYVFLGRELPGRRSTCALAIIGLGAFGYVASDAQFALQGVAAYYSVMAYFFMICLDMTYGKRITSSVHMRTISGSVLYTSSLSWLPMLAISASAGQLQQFKEVRWTPTGVFFLALSCVVGAAISYCGWWCRSRISATSFTVVGVMSKMLTVLLNIAVWDKHASPTGLGFLALCLVGGGLYQQAPLRSTSKR